MKNFTCLSVVLCGLFIVIVNCKSIEISNKLTENRIQKQFDVNNDVVRKREENLTANEAQVQTNKRKEMRSGRSYIVEMIDCAVSKNVVCFLKSARGYIAQWRNGLVVEANEEARTAVGQVKEQSSIPSKIFTLLSRLTTEVSNIFTEGMQYFRSAKEETKENAEDVSGSEKSLTERNSEVEGRKKKDGKIKRLIKLIKLILLVAALVVKICVLVKLFTAALQFKFLLIALAGLVLNAIKFWLELKKSHHPQKVIYYEHAQHQHHYEHDDDWSGGHPHGGDESYWGRSYDEEEDQKSAQDLAYAQQKPAGTVYSRVSEKPNYSWLG